MALLDHRRDGVAAAPSRSAAVEPALAVRPDPTFPPLSCYATPAIELLDLMFGAHGGEVSLVGSVAPIEVACRNQGCPMPSTGMTDGQTDG